MSDLKILPDRVSMLTMDGVSNWFSQQGKIAGAGLLDFNRTLASYRLKKADVGDLSTHVANYVTEGTGYPLLLPTNWSLQGLNTPIGHYAIGATEGLMTALPGQSGTIPTGPILTIDAMSQWFAAQGMIGNVSELDLNRTLTSYGLKSEDIIGLSGHVVALVGTKAGHPVTLPVGWDLPYLHTTVGRYAVGATAHLMSALPGGSGTHSSGPINTK